MNEETPGTIYCPYIHKNVATIVNGVVIWDARWWANLWYQFINRVSPKRRRIINNFREFSKKKVEVSQKYLQ